MHEVISIIILVLASTIDTLIAGFIYGIGKIKIPLRSSLVIGLVSSIVFTVSIACGTIIGQYLSERHIKIICFILLVFLGMMKFGDGLMKDFIRRHQNAKKQMRFHLSQLTFVLTVFANPEKADQDDSKELSMWEAVQAAIAFSFDGVGVGIIAGITSLNLVSCFSISFIVTITMLFIGLWIGMHCSRYFKHDISWLSGVLLILFAIVKL